MLANCATWAGVHAIARIPPQSLVNATPAEPPFITERVKVLATIREAWKARTRKKQLAHTSSNS